MSGLHFIDILIVIAYIVTVIYLGKRAAAASRTEEGFFLAGRKLGKVYQFFLNFGNATEPQGAVSTGALVYQKGISGVWLQFQAIFINPYQWFMNMWFRRVRLTTMADLFEDRFDSKWLSRVYAIYQIGVAVLLIAVGCFTAFKISSSLALKPENTWTAEEKSSVTGFYRLYDLNKQKAAAALAPAEEAELKTLQEAKGRGELHSTVSYLSANWTKWVFCLVFVAIVGAYIMLGGMKGAAFNDALQGILIVIFSVLLIPAGLSKIGGWGELAHKVPRDMFELIGRDNANQFTFWSIVAITLVSIVQLNALSPNMAIFGAAKDEYAARFGGVIGTYAKRFIIILWAFTGLIAIALYTGVNALADPDLAWGTLSKDLLGPGLLGLMLAGVIAGVMSNLAAKAVAISSLFVRNLYRHIWPDASEPKALAAARWAIVVVLLLGVFTAVNIPNFESAISWVITVNVPFGAAIMLMFFWRRVTCVAVWWTVVLCAAINIILPLTGDLIPSIAQHPALTKRSAQVAIEGTNAQGAAEKRFAWVEEGGALTDAIPGPGEKVVGFTGVYAPIYFKELVRSDAADPASPLAGKGRFNMEAYFMSWFGYKVARMSPTNRENLQRFFDGLFPFAVLIAVSFFTKRTGTARLDQFYGKMKTPVGLTPESETAAMEETRRNPRRFDHTKLFPGSEWEFAKWDKVDTIGFIGCCVASAAIIGLFVSLLKLASGA